MCTLGFFYGRRSREALCEAGLKTTSLFPMNPKNLIIITLIATIFSLVAIPAHAAEQASAASSAKLSGTHDITKPDNRAKILRLYLEKYNSPLAGSAETFVKAADDNDLDWRFVAAISGVESTFAHHLPYESYNAWGWGIYGDNMIKFSSYDEAIVTISKALRTNYINKWGAQDVHQIGRFYASSPTWSTKVVFFMNQMEKFQNERASETLSISL